MRPAGADRRAFSIGPWASSRLFTNVAYGSEAGITSLTDRADLGMLPDHGRSSFDPYQGKK
jgi:hypothetical protein